MAEAQEKLLRQLADAFRETGDSILNLSEPEDACYRLAQRIDAVMRGYRDPAPFYFIATTLDRAAKPTASQRLAKVLSVME